MIEFPITLTSGGSVCLPGYASALALGYAKNKSVYRLAVTATGEWAGLTADDIAEVEALAQAYYDALDAEDKADAEENTKIGV
jgi:hypothetical protein